MTRWLKPVELKGELVTLIPLAYSHSKDLAKACQDGELHKLWFTSVPHHLEVESYIETALNNVKNGSQLAFAVRCNQSEKLIGCTRYCNIDHRNKRLEIGYTWYAKSYQRTGANTEAKLLLLTQAFEALSCIAVEFRTHHLNQASRTAIARLGAKQDGILRQHQKMADGSYRDTLVFSILNSEWPAVKNHLKLKLQGK